MLDEVVNDRVAEGVIAKVVCEDVELYKRLGIVPIATAVIDDNLACVKPLQVYFEV
jgi:hypothetical protein